MSEPAQDTEQAQPEAETTEPEPEPTGDVDEAEGAPEPEPEQDEPEASVEDAEPAEAEPAPPSEKEMERALRALDKEAVRHAGRVQDIMGEDFAALQACPMCAPNAPGFRWPVMPEPERLALIKIAIGEDPDPPLLQDPHTRRCSVCDGRGVTKTDAYVVGQDRIQCWECKGRGWMPTDSVREQTAVGLASAEVANVPDYAAPATTAESPEEASLKARGAIVVWPIKPETSNTGV